MVAASPPAGTPTPRPVVVERRLTPRGELALRHCPADGHHEIISNGVFLMDTRGGTSERLLVRAALDGATRPARVLLGGLGVGFSLVAALAHPRTAHVTVVELEPAVIDWHATHLAAWSGGALDDPRVTVARADLVAWLGDGTQPFDVICADIDNGPEWTVSAGNAQLYGDTGLTRLRRRLAADGVLAVWSAAPSAPFEARLRRHFAAVQVHTVAVRRGVPDHVYVARGPLPVGPAASAQAGSGEV